MTKETLRHEFTNLKSLAEGSTALYDESGDRLTFDRDACKLSDGREAVIVKHNTEIPGPNAKGTFISDWT